MMVMRSIQSLAFAIKECSCFNQDNAGKMVSLTHYPYIMSLYENQQYFDILMFQTKLRTLVSLYMKEISCNPLICAGRAGGSC